MFILLTQKINTSKRYLIALQTFGGTWLQQFVFDDQQFKIFMLLNEITGYKLLHIPLLRRERACFVTPQRNARIQGSYSPQPVTVGARKR